MKYLILATAFFVPSSVSAQVIVNEIAWMGSPVDGVDARQEWRYEWVELYNPTETAVLLEGWSIALYRSEGEADFVIPLAGTVAPQGYVVVAASDKIPGVDISYSNLSGKFYNGGQRVVLQDNVGNVVEEVDARERWFAGDNDNKFTMERRFAENDANDLENWGSSLEAGGTPKAENTLAGTVFVPVKAELGEAPVEFFAKQKEGFVQSSPFPFLLSRQFAIALGLALGSALLVLGLKKLVLPRLEE